MLFYIEKKKKKKIRIFKKSLLLQLKKFQIPFDSARSFREEDSFVRIYPRRYRGKRRGNFKPSSVSGVSIPLLKVNTRTVLKFHPRQNRIPERSGSRVGRGRKKRKKEREKKWTPERTRRGDSSVRVLVAQEFWVNGTALRSRDFKPDIRARDLDGS